MKLPRPHIPITTRLAVASRQLRLEFGIWLERGKDETSEIYLDRMLGILSALKQALFQPMHLDHDPALCNRKFNERTGKFKPDANDPEFLVYRTKNDHETKTRIRGEGAQLSDLALRRKNKRIAKRILTGKRPKYGVAK